MTDTPPQWLCMQDAQRTWFSCFPCLHSHVNVTACPPDTLGSAAAAQSKLRTPACDDPAGFDPIDVSMYAPQLAWWLSFFPPERFLVLPSSLLHDPAQQVQVRAAALLGQRIWYKRVLAPSCRLFHAQCIAVWFS